MPAPLLETPPAEKVPAAEYARRHGWRTSAVVHRIRAGIYNGVCEDGTWYVLPNGPVTTPPVAKSEAKDAEPLLSLPWNTAPYPLKWVTGVYWTVVAFVLYALFVNPDAVDADSFFLSWSLFSGAIAYEAVRTGTVRSGAFSFSIERQPVSYILLTANFLLMSITALFLMVFGNQ